MKILWLSVLSFTGCVTTYKSAERIRKTPTEENAPSLKYKSDSIAVFPVEFNPIYEENKELFLLEIQQKIGSDLKDQGFDHVILLNELNANNVKADHYLKLSFNKGEEGICPLLGAITFFIFPLVLPCETSYVVRANVAVFDASHNRVHFQEVSRTARRLYHSLMIPLSLFTEDYDKTMKRMRDDAVYDISDTTETFLRKESRDLPQSSMI